MSDKEENSEAETPTKTESPTIIETEEKEIPERKPPNDKIVEYNIVEDKEKIEEPNSG